jgi:hypothetical protein
MDPDAALERLRKAMAELEYLLPGPDILKTTHLEDAVPEALEAFDELDRWLSRGGFAPAEWKLRG